MADIRFERVGKSYGAVRVVEGLDLAVRSGEFVVLLGESGCGKTTLLRMLAGLETVSDGDILIDGRRVNDLEPKDRGCAMVFQNYALFPHMDVRGNLAYGMRLAGVPAPERERRIAEAARALAIPHLLERRPSQLSGGQRQRVAIGRAMVRQPKVFLFDEPLSNLDARLRAGMRIELRRLHDRIGSTSIFVTHDQAEAMTLADRIVVMNRGRIEQVGSPAEIYGRPASLYVAGFIGSPPMNLIEVAVEGLDPGGLEGEVSLLGQRLALQATAGERLPARLVVGLRPEELRLDPDGAPVMVEGCENLGHGLHVHCLHQGQRLVASVASQTVGLAAVLHLSFDARALAFLAQRDLRWRWMRVGCDRAHSLLCAAKPMQARVGSGGRTACDATA